MSNEEWVYERGPFSHENGILKCKGLDLWAEPIHIKLTNINHKGLQRTANEYTEKRRIYKDLISKNNSVDILNA